jgi:hypothetical protein
VYVEKKRCVDACFKYSKNGQYIVIGWRMRLRREKVETEGVDEEDSTFVDRV